MRFGVRFVVGIGVAAAGVAASMLVVSMATASAQRGHATSATAPTTADTAPTTTASVPTTTTTAGPCTLAPADTTTTTETTGSCHPNPPVRRSARVVVEINNERPVAGRTFRGLTFRLLSPRASARITWVECDAKIAGQRLRARQRSFYSSGLHKRVEVVCRWRIPPDAGGKRLRLWTYESGGRARAWVVHALPPRVAATGRVASASWLVKR